MNSSHSEYCVKCGQCCKNISTVVAIYPEFAANLTPSGACKYLNTDNLCSIYTQRPDACRWEKVYERFFTHLTPSEFAVINLNYCYEFQKQKDHKL
jgi:uncharacterized protein